MYTSLKVIFSIFYILIWLLCGFIGALQSKYNGGRFILLFLFLTPGIALAAMILAKDMQ